MLGHTTIELTQRYAHLAESAIERAGAETGLDVTTCQFDAAESPETNVPKRLVLPAKVVAPSVELESTTDALGKRCATTKLAEVAGRDRALTGSADPVLEAVRRAHAALYGQGVAEYLAAAGGEATS